QNPRRLCIRPHDQITARSRRTEVGGRRAPAPTLACRALEISSTFLTAIVEVVPRRQPCLNSGLYQTIGQLGSMRLIRNMQRTADAVVLVGSALLMFRFFEIGQYTVPIPTGTAALPPLVVIGSIPAHIYHAID